MAKFQPGQSGNPGGRPKMPEDVSEAKKLTRVELERSLNRFLAMSVDDLQAYVKAKDGTALEFMIATIVLKGIQGGDTIRLNFLLDRLVGKVPDKLESDIRLINPFKDLTHEEKLAKARLAVALLEKPKDE